MIPGDVPATQENKDRILSVIYGTDHRDIPLDNAGWVFTNRLQREFPDLEIEHDYLNPAIVAVLCQTRSSANTYPRRLRKLLGEYVFGKDVLR